MKKIFFLILIISHCHYVFNQNLDIGNRIDKVPDTFDLIGKSSTDNSKIYRFNGVFPTTVFSHSVDKYEIKIHNQTIVSTHFVLLPKDQSEKVPSELIQKLKAKSGIDPVIKGSKYYFDDGKVRTVIHRKNEPLYGGDKIFVMVIYI